MQAIALSKNNPSVGIANVAQRYVLQTPGVGSVLIGVRNSDHVRENRATYEFELDGGEMEELRRLVDKVSEETKRRSVF